METTTGRVSILLVLISTVALVAMGQDAHSHDPQTTESAWSRLIGSMAAMHAATASVEPSDNADVGFVTLMLPHHRAALEMARTELLYGKDPQIRRLALEIVTDQQSEIELMQLWLRKHGKERPE